MSFWWMFFTEKYRQYHVKHSDAYLLYWLEFMEVHGLLFLWGKRPKFHILRECMYTVCTHSNMETSYEGTRILNGTWYLAHSKVSLCSDIIKIMWWDYTALWSLWSKENRPPFLWSKPHYCNKLLCTFFFFFIDFQCHLYYSLCYFMFCFVSLPYRNPRNLFWVNVGCFYYNPIIHCPQF